MPLAKQAAEKALELDQNLSEAHASLGRILNSFDYDWDNAEREFTRSIRLKPNYPTVHQWYAELLAFRGRHDEALTAISTALELDPLSLTINRMKGNILTFAGRNDEAIVQLNRTAELYPENSLVRYNLGDAYAAKGAFRESVEQYLTAFRIEGRSVEELKVFSKAFRENGWQGFWQQHLQAELAARNAALANDKNAYVNNESMAYAFAAVKNKDKSLEHLKLAFEERDPYLITLGMSGVYDFLRNEPEFKQIIKNVGLPE
jgi:tetratricopeptide (TPR) repeat protein